ncbi:hypothetical protein LHGZ1_2157 [Laribacter hongkongensis]|uniref:Uncharacterized protein n=1 Tax=Laribacter hongkongensis TaxID=168471 RepID=A0A248LJR8_9NEIS|nr:hypothetical protein LHGZ1_2157 [Laribacter hongkongensis]
MQSVDTLAHCRSPPEGSAGCIPRTAQEASKSSGNQTRQIQDCGFFIGTD